MQPQSLSSNSLKAITLDSIKDSLISLSSSDSEEEYVNKIQQHIKRTPSAKIDFTGIPNNLFQGSIFWKIPYNSKAIPRKRFFRLKRSIDPDGDLVLTWSNPSRMTERPREISLSHVTEIRTGQATKAFEEQIKKRGTFYHYNIFLHI